jgi:Chromo (CHRromatin Organisation MOdifier) domain
MPLLSIENENNDDLDNESDLSIDKILEERRIGRGFQYLVKWQDPPHQNAWQSRESVKDTKALDIWEQRSLKAETLLIITPSNVTEAIKSKEANEWINAMKSEFNSLM